MRNQTRKLTFLLSVIFFPFLLVELARADQSSILALFVFGDSLVDNGNNNYLATIAKSNYQPYGIDYPNETATGRWTDGKNVVDFIAGYVNMSSPPPFYSITSQLAYKNCTGVNFASGSCGILPITGKQYGECSDFDMQLENFKAALKQINLTNFPNNPSAFNQYMSQSICAIVIGNNDYINNYFNSYPLYLEYKSYTCSQFAEILANNFSSKLQELYSLGCTKFIVASVAAVGCCPYERIASGGLPPNTCNETQNDCVNLYNEELRVVLTNLTANHAEVKYIYADIFAVVRNCAINASSCGVVDSSNPCCTTYLNGTCIPIPDALLNVPLDSSYVCDNRSAYFYWDDYHPNSNVVYNKIFDSCTNPTNPDYPSPCDKPFSYLF